MRRSASDCVTLIENVSNCAAFPTGKKKETQNKRVGDGLFYIPFFLTLYCVFSPFVPGLGAVVGNCVGLTTQHEDRALTTMGKKL